MIAVVHVIHCFFVPSNEGTEKGTERGGCNPTFGLYLAVATNLRSSAAFERFYFEQYFSHGVVSVRRIEISDQIKNNTGRDVRTFQREFHFHRGSEI